MSMKIFATIEARMTSNRLPGKVLLPAAGKPMLEHQVNRLRAVTSLNGIVLATTVNKTDNELEEFAKKIAVNSFNDLKNSYTWDIRALNITKDIKFNK